MATSILTPRTEFKDLRCKWQTLSIYEKFEQTVVAILTIVIGIIVARTTSQVYYSRSLSNQSGCHRRPGRGSSGACYFQPSLRD